MTFFSRRKPAGVERLPKLSEIDQIIFFTGRITDQTILECFAQSRAESISFQQSEVKRLEKEYPGYRAELNRQRALAGLPPL